MNYNLRKGCIAIRRQVIKRRLLLLKGFVSCTCIAAIALVPLWEVLLYSKYNFHHPQPARNDYISGFILNFSVSVILAVLFFLFRFLFCQKSHVISAIVTSFCLISALNQIRVSVGLNLLPDYIASATWFKLIPLMFCFLFVVFSRFLSGYFWKTVPYFFVFQLIILAKLGLGFLKATEIERTVSYATVKRSGQKLTNRVVWIVFDELDYRLAFPERPKQVDLPRFDQLLSKSFNFTNAVPPASATIVSIPSLIDGVFYNSAYPISASKLMLRSSGDSFSPWGTQPNIFTDVNDMGGKCAVAGWYLPYSRIFGASVESVHWVAFSPEGFVGLGGNLFDTLKIHLMALTPITRQFLHRINVDVLETYIDEVACNPEFDFCFIHLPAPHLPSLNRNAGYWYFGSVNGYLENLTIADSILGRCLDKIADSSVCNKTTVIVSSDHPWRVSYLYDGATDPRVPLIVRFPGQNSRVDLGGRVNTVNTRRLVSKILGEQLVVNQDAMSNLLNIFFINR